MNSTTLQTQPTNSYLSAFRGRFIGIMQWQKLTEFWRVLKARSSDGWYIYAIGEDVPTETVGSTEVIDFVREIDTLIRKEHQEDYCGIVYTDSQTNPSFIKIFDPSNLGVVCGFSDNPPLPGWVISIIPPVSLDENTFLPANRRRWWKTFWRKAS